MAEKECLVDWNLFKVIQSPRNVTFATIASNPPPPPPPHNVKTSNLTKN